jgi:hypothetical protein
MTQQINFFALVTTAAETVPVSVYRDGDCYRANIAGGWWVATGKTEQAAINAVVAKYEQET